jgi:hypothetical protein
MENKYSIVLPTRGLGDAYELFLKYALPLYEKYLNQEEIFEFVIICPRNNIEKVKEDTKESKFKVSIYNDDEIINEEMIKMKNWGHQHQQIIKILISQYIKTNYYFIIDDDMFITKKLNFSDLFDKEGKIYYGYEEWPEPSLNKGFQTHHLWLEGACESIGIDIEYLKKEKFIMGVTPQLFVTSIVKELVDYLDSPINIARSILLKTANEFGLYWCYLIKTNNTNLYFPNNKYFTYDDSIHVLHHCSEKDIIIRVCNGFISKCNYFVVILSHLKYPNHLVSHAIENAINYQL